MAIDNSLYDSLQNAYVKIQNYLDTTKLGPEHSPMMVQQEELADLLERLDIELIEEQSKDINGLHEELNAIKEDSEKIIEALNETSDSIATVATVVSSLKKVFSKITPMIV